MMVCENNQEFLIPANAGITTKRAKGSVERGSMKPFLSGQHETAA
jgi:hypothetical protein